MKARSVLIFFCSALSGWVPPVLAATEPLKLEPVLFVFKDADFSKITIGTNVTPEPGRGLVFAAPVAFDQEQLLLNGAEYSWNGGTKAPAQFSLVATPVISIALGEPAAVLCALPIQYLEKDANGALQARNIPRDSPDVPHYRLTFNVRPAEASPANLEISCQLDMATMKGREKIQGIELEAGRPILTRFKENFRFKSPAGEWTGLVVRNPGGSDYSVLLLLKISREGAPTRDTTPTARPLGTALSGESGLAAFLVVSASDSTELKLDWDRRTRRDKGRFQQVGFQIVLKGKAPVYRDSQIRQDTVTPASYRGTVTLGPKQEWVLIDLQEIVSKPGEAVRTEPCPANGKYLVEEISNGGDLHPADTPVSPFTPSDEGTLRMRVNPPSQKR